MNNQGRQGGFSSNYPTNMAHGWRNNHNQGFGWKHEIGSSKRQAPYQQQPHYPSIHERTSKLEDTFEKFMQASLSNQKNTEASIRNLETQVGQLAKQLADNQGSQFSTNTQTNHKDHYKSITTRSGKVIRKGIGDDLVVEEEVLKDKESEKEQIECEGGERRNKEDFVDVGEEIEKKNEKQGRSVPIKDVPYPHAPTKKCKERQFARFMDILKILQINIHFTEALKQMPTYAKFMKGLLTKKRKINDKR